MKFPAEKYGLEIVTAKKLGRDINYSTYNYLLTDSNGIKYIFKVYRAKDDLETAREEIRIVSDIKNKVDFSLPETINSKSGEAFVILGKHEEGRLIKYIEGDFLSSCIKNDKLLYKLGKHIAALHLALGNTDSYLVKSRKLFWDIQNAHLSFGKVSYIKNPEIRKSVKFIFDHFHHEISPVLAGLRHSIIHGDLNDNNILVSGNEITGIIDFGDISYSPLINELAVASAYLMNTGPDPFSGPVAFIRGFNSLVKLEKTELSILPWLITTRICISLCNSAEKQALSKGKAEMFTDEQHFTELLSEIISTNPGKIKDRLYTACNIREEKKHTDTRVLQSRRNKILSSSLSLSYSKPIYLHSALFQYMFDYEGKTYLDAYNNIPHVGHSHPMVAEAVSRQLRKLNTNTRYLYDSIMEYSENLLKYFPDKLNKVFFVNSGSAASDLASRLAINYTGRKDALVLEHGYHGNTTRAIELSHYKFNGPGGSGETPGTSTLSLPKAYMGKYCSSGEYIREAIEDINKLISDNRHPAFFIAEPISGCGGQVPLADGYLHELYPFLKENGILTISDEVQVGFGRLGEHFWGFEMHEIEPDLVILGKPMANGHPVGAVVTTSEIADSFDNGMEFFSSFGGNPVSCEAAKAVLKIIEEEDLRTNALETGNYYIEGLKQLMADHQCIGDVRGQGLFIGIELVHNDGSPGTDIASWLKNELKNNYILTGTDGPFNNVIKSKPPLCFNRKNVDRVIDTMDKLLKNKSPNG